MTADAPKSVSRIDRFAPLGLFAFAWLALLPLRRHGLMVLDDGWYLQPTMRMMEGEVLYRDVWVFYAPGIYHLLAWLFEATGGPSIATARLLWIASIATSAALAYRLMRRFAPPWLAWLPAVTYVLVPGPWQKSYYATLTLTGFVALARCFERPSVARFAVLGLSAGVAFVTRQDVGLALLGIALVAAPLPGLFPNGFGRAARSAPWPQLAAVLAGAAIPFGAAVAWYAVHGALDDAYEAAFVHAFGQANAHPPALAGLRRLLSPATFALASEGRGVGILMLLPLAVYAALTVVVSRRVLRDGIRRDHALLAALLAFGVATLTQAYRPMLLLRFLQSAVPFYLLATIAASQASVWLRARGAGAVALAPVVVLAGAAAWLVTQVVFGLPGVVQPIYTGSARVLRLAHPVDVLGDRFYESFATAEEIRLVRAFYSAHAAPDEPTLGLPIHALYNAILERPNPTRYIHDHPSGEFIMTADMKQAEAERLLASPARFVLVDQGWYARPAAPDPLLRMLRAEFHPVRGYGSTIVLERGNDPAWTGFAHGLRRALATGPKASDVAPWRTFADAHPDEPLAWRMLGLALAAARDRDAAVAALHRAAALDPFDVTPLETSGALLLDAGRVEDARADVARARAVRNSPALDRLEQALARSGPPR